MMELALTLVTLSVPHWLYALVWLDPSQFVRMTGSVEPIKTLMAMAWWIKLVQLVAFTSWYLSTGGFPELQDMGFLRMLLGVGLIAVGQSLNIGIYRAIGTEGVYYGCKFGAKIPWVNGFPFTWVDHPQYVGSVMSFWGAVVLLATAAHTPGLWIIGGAVTAYYTTSGIIEHNL